MRSLESIPTLAFSSRPLAGAGPLSDGIPEPIGRGGSSEREMPPPPPASRPLYDADKTVRMRKARP